MILHYPRTNRPLILINKPFEVKWPAAWKNGASLITAKYQREVPEAKTINYIRSVRFIPKAHGK